MKRLIFLLNLLSPIFVFSMDIPRGPLIKNKCAEPITICYKITQSDGFLCTIFQMPANKEGKLAYFFPEERYITVLVPGFEPSRNLFIREKTTPIIIKSESKHEIIVVQGFNLLGIMKALKNNN
jgi:hypothetical protein